MNKIKLTFTTLALFAFTLAFAAIAHAQSQRTFVSTSGSDANTASLCSATNPCRTFNAAQTVTNIGGEIVVLTSGGYGPVEINKSVQLIAPTGVHAAITAFSGNAITVASSGRVVLRGLTLNGLGASDGINVTAVGALHIENCIVNGFSGNGITVALAADGSEIFVKDTIVRNNGGNGIVIETTTGTVRASIDGCRAENNFNGFFAFNRSRVTVSNSVASGNGSVGFRALSAVSGASAEMSAESCVANNNAVGFVSNGSGGGTATMRVARSTATNNNTGFFESGGVFRSLGNNLVRGNTMNIDGTITIISGN